MRATVMYRAGDVRIENIPDATIVHSTDAVIRITRACICGSDLWPYNELEPTETGRRMGHEAIGVVEDVSADVHTVKRGDVVVMSFAYSDGTCMFCDEGLQTSCIHGGFFGTGGEAGGAQAEALRIPQADGTLFVLPVGADDALMPSLLTLSDVMGTGHHAAVRAKVGPGRRVAVVGDGAAARTRGQWQGAGWHAGPGRAERRCHSARRALVAHGRRAESSGRPFRQGDRQLFATNEPWRYELIIAHTSSGSEELAKRLPKARIVSAFNTVPSEVLFKTWITTRPCPALCQNGRLVTPVTYRSCGSSYDDEVRRECRGKFTCARSPCSPLLLLLCWS